MPHPMERYGLGLPMVPFAVFQKRVPPRGDCVRPGKTRGARLSRARRLARPVSVDQRTHYCGTPEPDRFKHDAPGTALLVTIAGSSSIPVIRALPTATFTWRSFDLHLLEGDAPESALNSLLPALRERRNSLIRVVASGHTRLPARAELAAALKGQLRISLFWSWTRMDWPRNASWKTWTRSIAAAPCVMLPMRCLPSLRTNADL